jgi:hypothetical protein
LKLCGFVAPRCRSWGSPRFGFQPTPLRVLAFALLDDASTLRSFSLAGSRPSHPFGRILPSCPSPLPRRSEDLRILFLLRTPCGVLGFSRTLTWDWVDFRVLSRRSSPPRPVSVSTNGRVLLPWVSPSARDLILVGFSADLLHFLAEVFRVRKRARP